MKKIALIAAAVSLTAAAFSQDLTNKKGESILPQQGDWAIGINADPFLSYFGNLFNGNPSNAAPTLQYPANTFTFTGKKFIADNQALRARLRVGIGSTKQAFLVNQDLVNTTTTDTTKRTEDFRKTNSTNFAVGFGKEWRRGKTRLQGFYGFEGIASYSGGATKYEYGNEFSADNPTPTSYNYNSNTSGPQSLRVVETTAGNSMGLGVRGFLGAEYFILAKLSIGAEYGWGLGFTTTSEGSRTSETWDPATSQVKSIIERTSGRTSSWGFDNDINGARGWGTGSLMITLHF